MDIARKEGERDVMSPIEIRKNLKITFYNSSNDDICFHCGTVDELERKDNCYPICFACVDKKKEPVQCNTRSAFKPKDTT